MKQASNTNKYIFIAITLAVMLVGGAMDLTDAEHAERDYCNRVKAGEHPHYNKSIDCDVAVTTVKL